MRYVAQGFVKLMEKYPFLETAAFVVIGVLGLKLTSSVICHFNENNFFCKFLESEESDMYISLITVGIFVAPMITSYFFNYPHHKRKKT